MQENVIIPENYKPVLGIEETEKAISLIKEFFQLNLALELDLIRTTAPLFVKAGTGLNDNLNGVEKPVSFRAKSLNNQTIEIVQSLAKWKRMILTDYQIPPGQGIYTDMNAIRPDEELDNIHSLYVDQWDWERTITPAERHVEFLKSIVRKVYQVIKRTEKYVCHQYPVFKPYLPNDITFVHSEELVEKYPDVTPKEREKRVCQDYGAVFIIGIGAPLKDGQPHDGRAPDYDDWSTPTVNGFKGLNGDILVHYPLLDTALELSSMGIRVNAESLDRQLELCNNNERRELYFHKRLLSGEMVDSIGGGIGQSRLCMLFLRRAHIGEIQSSIWSDEMIQYCKAHDINIL